MRTSRRVLVVGALIVAGLVAVAAPAGAAPAPAPRVASIEVVTSSPNAMTGAQFVASAPAKNKAAAQVAAAAATTCWYIDVTRRGKDIFGITLVTLHTRTNWCGDGSWIRNYAYTNWDASWVNAWAFEGLTQNYDQYGVNWNQFHSVRQAQFCLVNCIAQSIYLTNDISVGPAGQVYHT
jgi:hypothetical protein